MNWFNLLLAAVSAWVAVSAIRIAPCPEGWGVACLFGVFSIYVLAIGRAKGWRKKPVVKLKGLAWTQEDFCRGWLITGDTGSGKTRSGITAALSDISE
jgi:hypothetical protein